MRFTDIFIRRPVLAAAISILIFLLGFASLMTLNTREYPKMSNTIITVTTQYPGASAKVVAGYITRPLENSIAAADGIDYMTSTSHQGESVINIYVRLNYPPDNALTEVTGKVDAVLNLLPKAAESPTIVKETGNTFPQLIIGFKSKVLEPKQITAYLANVVLPAMFADGGISGITIWGEKKYAMRIWLNPQKMAVLGVTPAEVYSALEAGNLQGAPGKIKMLKKYVDLDSQTTLHSAQEFDNLVVKKVGTHLIRIRDVGRAELGVENYDTQVEFDGKPAVFLAFQLQPSANPINTINKLRQTEQKLKRSFPSGLTSQVTYDSTDFVHASIKDVIHTIFEAVLIVVIVIFLFLGSVRAMIIPIVAIPLSLVGVCLLMAGLGYSINTLTLLAMVLAIGLVVDDAIVILENIFRHLEEGGTPFQAAIIGAREVASPIIVMSTTLVAVFAPIGFMGGLTGSLFTEFAFTLASCVIISAIIALTLSPMLCSKIVSRKTLESKMVKRVDHVFNYIRDYYSAALSYVLTKRVIVVLFGVAILGCCALFYTHIPGELAPQEDEGVILVLGQAPSFANLGFMKQVHDPLNKVLTSYPKEEIGTFMGLGIGLAGPQPDFLVSGFILKPWDQRSRTEMSLMPSVQAKLDNIPGVVLVANELASLPGTTPPPVQFVLKTTGSLEALYPVMEKLEKAAKKSGLFLVFESDLRFDMPNVQIHINRNKAEHLGISVQEISNALDTMFGDNYINFWGKQDYSFEVIPQVPDDWRRNVQQLGEVHIATDSGKLIPLSSVVSFTESNQPQMINHFDQLNSATFLAVPKTGVALGTALTFLKNTADKIMTKNDMIDYGQESRQFAQAGDALVLAFLLAIIVIFLVLSMQFESFRDPLIILVSVPMSMFGALLPMYFGAATINIYTQIGLITLIGLISKHGILIVEFANKLQEHDKMDKVEAIKHAAAIRLRPILMTALAMIFGVVPLLIASGAGAVSRFNVGLVIFMGLLIGTFFTLFMVPTMYTLIGQDRVKGMEKKAKIQKMPKEHE